MIVCTRCGASNQPTSKFCLSCGAPLAAAQPGGGAPQPQPQGPAAHYVPPSPGAAGPAPAPMAPPAQPLGQWGAPQAHYAPPPAHGAPPQQPWGDYAPPPPQPGPPAAWGPAPAQAGFAPAQPQPFQATPGAGPDPFGSTVGPPQGAYAAGPHPHAAPYAPQGHAPSPYGPPQTPPPQQPYAAAPQAWAPAPQAPHPGGWEAAAPVPAPPQAPDPAPFAATAPPPTNEDFERAQSPSGPPVAAPAYAPPPQAPAPVAVAPSAPPAPQAFLAPADSTGLRTLAGFLVSYEATELGVFWPLYQGPNVVGRKGAAPGLDVELDHPTTSSRHAIIHATARPGRLLLEDPGSTNGTFVGEQMLEKNKAHELRDGENIRFGGFNLIVKII